MEAHDYGFLFLIEGWIALESGGRWPQAWGEKVESRGWKVNVGAEQKGKRAPKCKKGRSERASGERQGVLTRWILMDSTALTISRLESKPSHLTRCCREVVLKRSDDSSSRCNSWNAKHRDDRQKRRTGFLGINTVAGEDDR